MYMVTTLDFVLIFLIGALTFGAGLYSSTLFYYEEEKETKEIMPHIVTEEKKKKKDDDDIDSFYS